MSDRPTAMRPAVNRRALPGAWGVSSLLPLVLLQTVMSLGYELTAPTNYTVFSGGIPVTYSIPKDVRLTSGVVQLVSLRDRHVVAQVPLPAGYNNGDMTFMCGVVDRAGSYVFRMLDGDKEPALVESRVMAAQWPRTSLQLPADHQTLSGEVSVRLSISGALCDSPHSNTSYTLDMAFYGAQETTSHRPTPNVQIVHSESITKIANLRTTITFACSVFDQAGNYSVIFKSVHDPQNPLAVSNKMTAVWNQAYSLSSRSSSIFPCRRVLVVQYAQAQCSGNDDKIRLYKQVHKADSSVASPIDLVYMTERRARVSQDAVTFSCDLFHEAVAGYCLKYISTAGNGAVHEQFTMCLRTNDIEAPVVDGSWTTWSAWTACTTSCGGGQRNRVRTCDNPPPSIGGQYCTGETTQWQDCGAPCRETTTRLPLNSYTPDPTCTCGCTLLESRGTIVSSRRCLGSNLWIVRTVEGNVIQLNFVHFTVDPGNTQTWVKVRDGDSHMSDLLMHSSGERMPGPVKTTQNAMLIEFMAPFDQTPIYINSYEGFVADYQTMVDNSSALVVPADGSRSQKIWESTIAIVGITLCAIIILATVAFVCHHRVTTKRKKDKRAHVHEALLTSAGVANSPSHSGSVIGSPNISYSDPLGSPTKSPTKRDYVLTKGVTAQAHTPTSMSAGSYASDKNRPRKYGPPGGAKTGGREVAHAPGMSSQSSLSQATSMHTSPLPSPYALNAEAKDYCHDPKMFKTSSLPGDPPGQGGRTKGGHRPHGRHPREHGRDYGPYTPGSMSPAGSAATSPSRADTRPPGHRPKPPPGAPLAGEEDLSPTSPTKLLPPQSPAHRYSDNIQLDSIREPGKKKARRRQDTSLTEPSGARPPVEGRDSLHRGTGAPATREGDRRTPKPQTPSTGPTGLNTPDRQNANYIPGTTAGTGRPTVKPLPLRDVQRPDGQSPESRSEDPNANTPSSPRSTDLSPVLRPSKLFPDSQSVNTPSAEFDTNEDFEYDDYVPNLPGSYFTMDPDAYQLTWSNQQPWGKNSQPSRTASQASVDSDRLARRNNTTSNC